MSNDLVRQALELDDHLAAPAAKTSRSLSKYRKRRERVKRKKVATTTPAPDLVEKNVTTLLRNVKKVEIKKKFLKRMELSQVQKWHQPQKKKRKRKKEDKIPASAYDLSDVQL